MTSGPGAVADLLGRLVAAPPRLGTVRLLAIDGPSGSGKSVFADRVAETLAAAKIRVGLVRTDYFATWEDPVSWWPKLSGGVLDPFAEGRRGRYRKLDWSSGEPVPGEKVTVHPPDVLIVEGVSAGRASVADRTSLLVWVELPDSSARLERAVARDGERCRDPLRRWQDFESGWFAVDDTRARADVTIDVDERLNVG